MAKEHRKKEGRKVRSKLISGRGSIALHRLAKRIARETAGGNMSLMLETLIVEKAKQLGIEVAL